MAKKSQMKFSKLMLETKKEINVLIVMWRSKKSASHMISGNNKGYSY